LLFVAVCPLLLAYVFWDIAMRKGRMILVVSFSYLTPLLSTFVSCLYLRVLPGMNVWIACVLVIGGALICRYSIEAE
jgi:drug/metabolite transporter (DMT)-like permease